MKRVFWAVLVVCLLIAPARAEDIANQMEEETASEREDRIIVTTLDELKAAIVDANDGDTIEITQKIKVVNEYISTDKDITITCTENFADYAMFEIIGSSVIGLSFKGGGAHEIFAVTYFYGQEVIVQNCIFDGNDTSTAICVYGSEDVNKVRIIDCEFKNCLESAISARASTDVVIDRCYIHETYAVAATGAIVSSGSVTLNNCLITENSSYANAAVLCSGTLIVSGGQIRDNTIRSTDVGVAVDIFCSGTWSITDEGTGDAGYYDAATGEKLSLPIHESDTLARLVYLKDENAKEYFLFLLEPDTSEGNENDIPELPQEPVSPPVDDEGDDPPEQIPEPPKKPADSEEEKDEGDPSGKQPETPDQPLQGEDGNISDDDKPQSPDVLLGYGDGQLHEADSLTRAQLATIIFRLLDDDTIIRYGGAGVMFTDVAADAWYAPYVNAIGMAGIVNGVGDGMYDPDGTVTWEQIITILTRFVESESCELKYIQYDGWALEAIQTAVALGWIEDSSIFNPNDIISRGELVDLINTVLKQY